MGRPPHEPLDRFDDLLDPADDAAVLAALRVASADLLRGPDEVTARRHVRRLRGVTAPSPVRRTVAAAAVAVLATGVALASLGEVVIVSSPAAGSSEPSGPDPTGGGPGGSPEPEVDGPARFEHVPSAEPARSAPPFAGTLPHPVDLAPLGPPVERPAPGGDGSREVAERAREEGRAHGQRVAEAARGGAGEDAPDSGGERRPADAGRPAQAPPADPGDDGDDAGDAGTPADDAGVGPDTAGEAQERRRDDTPRGPRG